MCGTRGALIRRKRSGEGRSARAEREVAGTAGESLVARSSLRFVMVRGGEPVLGRLARDAQIGADLRAEGVIVPAGTGRRVVLALEDGTVVAVRRVEQLGNDRRGEADGREKRREDAPDGTRKLADHVPTLEPPSRRVNDPRGPFPTGEVGGTRPVSDPHLPRYRRDAGRHAQAAKISRWWTPVPATDVRGGPGPTRQTSPKRQSDYDLRKTHPSVGPQARDLFVPRPSGRKGRPRSNPQE